MNYFNARQASLDECNIDANPQEDARQIIFQNLMGGNLTPMSNLALGNITP